MKKLLCIVLSAIMLISMCSVTAVSAGAAETATNTMEYYVEKGDYISYYFNMDVGSIPVISYQGETLYSSNLELVLPRDSWGDPVKTKIFPVFGASTVWNYDLENTIKFNYSHGQAGVRFNNAGCSVINLVFKATATGTASVTTNTEYVKNFDQVDIVHASIVKAPALYSYNASIGPVPSTMTDNSTVYTSGDWQYTTTTKTFAEYDGTVVGTRDYANIVNYTGSATDVVVPDAIDDMTVISVDFTNFAGKATVTSVAIPDTVRTIKGIDKLTALAAIDVDPDNEFYATKDYVLYDKGITKLIAYPAKRANTSYTVPSTVTSLTLSKNSSIKTLTAEGSKTTSIKVTDCTALQTVNLGNYVKSFSMSGSYKIKAINAGSKNATYYSKDGVLLSKSKKSIFYYPPGKTSSSYTIPSTVVKLQANAFYNNDYLKTVTMSSGLTTICKNAFYSCGKLSKVVMNTKLTTIETQAFANCTSLKTLSVPKSLKTIGKYAYGYKYSSSKWSKQSGFTVRGYKSGKVYSNAKSYSLKFSDITPKSAKLNKTSLTLGVKETYTLTATISPSNKVDVSSWSSSNKKVATVSSSGKITAKKTGTTTITFKTSNGKKATCKVTVKKAPTKLGINKTKATVKVKKTVNLDHKFSSGQYSNSITWTSSNTKIATVSSSGVVKGVKKGTVTITAKTFNGKTAKCKITVK